MAAQVVQSSDGSQARESGGASYANAVLNFKTMDSNKENINAIPHSSTKEHTAKENAVKIKSNQPKCVKQQSANSEEFPQIIPPATRNSRRLSDKGDTNVGKSNSAPANGTFNEKIESVRNIDVNCDEGSNESEKVPEKKFVEAPLPKTNPWTLNKNAASVITGKIGDSKPPAALSSTEKRVLQPQQQGRVEVLSSILGWSKEIFLEYESSPPSLKTVPFLITNVASGKDIGRMAEIMHFKN